MPINKFGNIPSSHDNGNKTDISVLVQKLFLRSNFIESDIEEDIDINNRFKNRNLPCAKEISYAVCKSYVASGLNDPSIIRNTAHVDFNDKSLDNVRFVKVNSLPAVREHFTAKFYADEVFFHSEDDSPLLRLDPDENLELDEQDSIFLNLLQHHQGRK